MADIQKFGEEFQRASKDGFDASVRSLGEVSKGFQAIGTTIVDYAKKSFEDGTRAFEQLVAAKSYEQICEIQSQYAKKAFDSYVARPQNLARCMSMWLVVPTSTLSKPLPRPPGRLRSR